MNVIRLYGVFAFPQQNRTVTIAGILWLGGFRVLIWHAIRYWPRVMALALLAAFVLFTGAAGVADASAPPLAAVDEYAGDTASTPRALKAKSPCRSHKPPSPEACPKCVRCVAAHPLNRSRDRAALPRDKQNGANALAERLALAASNAAALLVLARTALPPPSSSATVLARTARMRN